MLRAARFFAAVTLGCLSIASLAASAFATEPAPRRSYCAELGRPSFDISKKPFDDAAKAAAQTMHTADVDLSFDGIIDIRGAGAGCVEGLTVDMLLLRSGEVYTISPAGYLVRRERSMSPYADAKTQAGPRLDGKTPSSVAAFSSSRYDSQRVGIWSGRNTSSIALFEAGPSGYSWPRVVGTTDVRLRGITYFGSPDAPIGTINVIHDIAPDHIEIWTGQLRDKPFVQSPATGRLSASVCGCGVDAHTSSIIPANPSGSFCLTVRLSLGT